MPDAHLEMKEVGDWRWCCGLHMVECNPAGVPHPCSHVRTLSTAHLVFLPNFARCHRGIPPSSLVPISGWLSSIATFEGVGFTPLSSNVSAVAAVVAVGAVGAADGLGLVGAVPLPAGSAPLPEEPPA